MLQLYPKTRKKTVSPVDYRLKILVSAIKVFSQKGFAKTTMSDVASRAKVGVGTLYNYFQNKDDLLLQCMKKTINDEIELIRIASEKITDPFEKLRYFLHEHRLLVENKPYIARFLIIELRQSEGFYKRNPSYNPMQYYLNYISGIFSEGVAQGKIRDVDPDIAALGILGTVDLLLTQWLISGREFDLEGAWNKFRDIIAHGMSKNKA
ncbi:MAG: TetR/AcrR family transcriptional regulator [Candidatus Cloacimonetes bacterium]|nr:TetR/AcrR family transcriptional regulator [Candidatus Cloacimonadota bacterium]